MKHDKGKIRMSILPWGVVEDIAAHMQAVVDSGKYPENDWQTVDEGERRYVDAALRHLSAHTQGEVFDPETKRSHLLHAAASVMMAYWHQSKNQGNDGC